MPRSDFKYICIIYYYYFIFLWQIFALLQKNKIKNLLLEILCFLEKEIGSKTKTGF